MLKYDIHVVRDHGGPVGEYLGRLETTSFDEAFNLIRSDWRLANPLEVVEGVFILDPLNDVGSRVLVVEGSKFYNTEVSEEIYEEWWDATFKAVM